MTDEEQEAGNLKWDRRGTVLLRRLSTGRYALYEFGTGRTGLFWIGDISDLETAYDARPEPETATYTKPPRSTHGVDLTKVEFKL